VSVIWAVGTAVVVAVAVDVAVVVAVAVDVAVGTAVFVLVGVEVDAGEGETGADWRTITGR
jgi:hypothetical protein